MKRNQQEKNDRQQKITEKMSRRGGAYTPPE